MKKMISSLFVTLAMVLFFQGNVMAVSPPTIPIESNPSPYGGNTTVPYILPSEVEKLCPELKGNIKTFTSLIERKVEPEYKIKIKEAKCELGECDIFYDVKETYKIKLPSGFFIRLLMHYEAEDFKKPYNISGSFVGEGVFSINTKMELKTRANIFVSFSIENKKVRIIDKYLDGITSAYARDWYKDFVELRKGEKTILKMGLDDYSSVFRFIQNEEDLPLDKEAEWKMAFFKALNIFENSVLEKIIPELEKLPDLEL